VQYAGSIFRTKHSQRNLKTDNSHLVMDYKPPGANQPVKQAYAQIKDLFEHEAYPGGPKRIVVNGAWFDVMGKCPIAGTTLVKKNRRNPFNFSSKFVFLDDCYQRPVAIWPHDPSGELAANDPKRKWFDVIDRNRSDDLDA
jgi:hypothetical protein